MNSIPFWSFNTKFGNLSPFSKVFILINFIPKIVTKKEKINFIIKNLNKLYPKIPVPLNHKDEYTLLIAVLLSAQSTDKRVNEITPTLFGRASNPQEMI